VILDSSISSILFFVCFTQKYKRRKKKEKKKKKKEKEEGKVTFSFFDGLQIGCCVVHTQSNFNFRRRSIYYSSHFPFPFSSFSFSFSFSFSINFLGFFFFFLKKKKKKKQLNK